MNDGGAGGFFVRKRGCALRRSVFPLFIVIETVKPLDEYGHVNTG
jgi:hypothetical protein